MKPTLLRFLLLHLGLLPISPLHSYLLLPLTRLQLLKKRKILHLQQLWPHFFSDVDALAAAAAAFSSDVLAAAAASAAPEALPAALVLLEAAFVSLFFAALADADDAAADDAAASALSDALFRASSVSSWSHTSTLSLKLLPPGAPALI